MRGLAFVLIVAAGACSAVDDFSRFKFDSGGAGGGTAAGGGGGGTAGGGGTTGGADLAVARDAGGNGPDLAGPLPGYGAPCVDECAAPNSCFHLGSKDPNGICTRTCSTSNSTACSGVDATCVTVEGMTLCMPNCNALANKSCRSDLTCCANGKPTTLTAGQCAPADTDFCGKS